MDFWKTIVTTGILTLSVAAAPASAQPAHEPTRVILDTDMWGDIDDLLALAMLNALQDRSEAKILAVTSSTDDKWSASFINLVETYYGRPGVPVGLVRGGVKGHPEWMGPNRGKPNYTRYVSELRDRTGHLLFPHKLIDGNDAPDSVQLLRKTLAAQPDRSVVMIQIGFSTNLARLLSSKGDQSSPLNGKELVRRKVKLLSLMGGAYSDFTRDGRRYAKTMQEFNLMFDIPSAQQLFEAWPTPIVASGFEIGVSMLFKGSAIDQDFSYAREHPVVATYRYTDPIWRNESAPVGQLHDHATWDPTAVLYAVRPSDGYFSLSDPGRISVQSDGSARFAQSPDGLHRYLIVNDEQRARALEAMMLLVTEPPTRTGQPKL